MKKIRLILSIIILNLILTNTISLNYNEKIENLDKQKNRTNIWVYFVDKGPINLTEKIQDLEKIANQQQIERRSKVRKNLFDFRDITVYQPYVTEILADQTIELRTTSKWLNAISISIPTDLIDLISSKSFVKKIEKVKSGKRKEVVNIKKYNDSYRNDYGPSYNQLEQINIIQAHENGYKGQGVKILILDTGFYTEHEAINENNGTIIRN